MIYIYIYIYIYIFRSNDNDIEIIHIPAYLVWKHDTSNRIIKIKLALAESFASALLVADVKSSEL